MSRLAAVLRGLAHRAGSTALILAVALVAVAAAATGPAYYAAARISIMKDQLAAGTVFNRGFEATATGALSGMTLRSAVDGQMQDLLGERGYQRLFAPPIQDLEGTGVWATPQVTMNLVWRQGECSHLQVSGACPARANQVMVSQDLARLYSLHPGQTIDLSGWPTLTITGIFRTRDLSADYWFGRAGSFFPQEAGLVPAAEAKGAAASTLDALLTAQATMTSAPPTAQGTGVLDYRLITSHVTVADVTRLASAMSAMVNSAALELDQIPVATQIPGSFGTIEASWRSMEVPIFLVTVQLLTVSWLMLFLAVTDAVDARGPEIALAKLRGRGRLRTLAFGLSEPALLLLVALPAGTAISLAATSALGSVLLRPGTPVTIPGLAWLAAAVVTAGGLFAVVIAASRTLRRPVTEQWRRADRRATDRGWVIDAILLTGAAAGLLELGVNGEISATRQSALSLLVPGLLGLAVAVIASRVLPLACRASFGRTRGRGGLSTFLAVRHIARRPGGIRTTIVLATAFALVAFAVTAWTVNRGNDRLVAYTQAGAATVLTVSVPPGKNLGAVVDKADPGGTKAAVVDRYTSLSSGSAGTTILAVDPQRFARVAFWGNGPSSFSAQPLSKLAAELDPREPAPVTVTGSAMRVTVTVTSLSVPGTQLYANVTTGASPVLLGTLPDSGTVTLTGSLVSCPCVLQNFFLQLPAAAFATSSPVSGSLVFTALADEGSSGWTSVRAGLFSDAGNWTPGDAFSPPDRLTATTKGLTWAFDSSSATKAAPTLASVNRPVPMPALVPQPLLPGGGGSTVQGVGLDASPLPLDVVAAVTAVPGAPATGFIVDRRYAELAANLDLDQADQQVWLAPGASGLIEPALAKAGIKVTSVASGAAEQAKLGREGPALASSLFLGDATAAAVLAVFAAILGLYLSARRRRYEYAALSASGVPHSRLRRAVLIELAVVLGYGSVVGIVTGLGAAALALRAVPEFISVPQAPPLSYVPQPAPLATALASAVVVLIVVAVILSITIIRGVKLEQLREAPA